MSFRTCKVLGVAAAIVCLGAAGCTDLTVEPKSTVTEANVSTDVSSYRGWRSEDSRGETARRTFRASMGDSRSISAFIGSWRSCRPTTRSSPGATMGSPI